MSSIYREIKRNSINEEYIPHNAQEIYKSGKRKCGAKSKLANSILLLDIKSKLLWGFRHLNKYQVELK